LPITIKMRKGLAFSSMFLDPLSRIFCRFATD
jgi:hypothetical protein